MKSAMYIMAVIVMMRTAGAWSVDRRGGRTAFMRRKMDASEKKKKELMNSIAIEEGASYQKMADTFETAEETAAIEVESRVVTAIEKNKQVKKSSALDVDGISMQRGSANRPGAEKKKSSPSNESSCDRSEKAGDDEEEEYIEEDEDWSDYKEQRGGIVKATPRDGKKNQP